MLIPEDGTGLPNANSFTSLDFANAYFTQRPNATWTDATDVIKESGLLYATRWLDRRYPWVGSIKVFDPPQALSFPRVGLVDPEGRLYSDSEVPLLIQEATCELAANQAGEGVINRLDDLGGPLSQITVDVITLKFRDWTPGAWSIRYISDLVLPFVEEGFGGGPGFRVGKMLRS